MKRQGLFFSGLFGSEKSGSEKKISTPPQEAPVKPQREVIITLASQPNVLQKRMQEKQLTHGETVTASFSPVRLEYGQAKMAIFFCPMNTLEIAETITPGDGREIPPNVVVEGLTVPIDLEPGMYSLKNVKLSSNGAMQVIATSKTTWEKFVAEPSSSL